MLAQSNPWIRVLSAVRAVKQTRSLGAEDGGDSQKFDSSEAIMLISALAFLVAHMSRSSSAKSENAIVNAFRVS